MSLSLAAKDGTQGVEHAILLYVVGHAGILPPTSFKSAQSSLRFVASRRTSTSNHSGHHHSLISQLPKSLLDRESSTGHQVATIIKPRGMRVQMIGQRTKSSVIKSGRLIR